MEMTRLDTGVICFYLNGDDIDNHRRVIQFLLKPCGHLAAEEPRGQLIMPDAKAIYALDIYGNRLYELQKHGDAFTLGSPHAPAAMAFEILR